MIAEVVVAAHSAVEIVEMVAVDLEGIVETRTGEMIEEEVEAGLVTTVIDLDTWQEIVPKVTVEEIAEEVDSGTEVVAGEAEAEHATIAIVKDTWQEIVQRVTEEIGEEDNSYIE